MMFAVATPPPPVATTPLPAPVEGRVAPFKPLSGPLTPGPEGSEGPDLPPMLPGLPNTDDRACKSLIGAILWQAIQDKDVHFIASHEFTVYGTLMGLEVHEVFAIRRAILSGRFKPTLYAAIPWRAENDRCQVKTQ